MSEARLDGLLLLLLGCSVFLVMGAVLGRASSGPKKAASRTDVPRTKARYGFADQAIAIVSGLSFVLVAVTVCTIPFTNSISGARDFVVYWATGQQLAQHANPYDKAALMRIEYAAGLSATSSVGYMRNPPWALPLTLPLGLAGLRVGGLTVDFGVACKSAGFGVLALAALRAAEQSAALARGSIRTRRDLPAHRADIVARCWGMFCSCVCIVRAPFGRGCRCGRS